MSREPHQLVEFLANPGGSFNFVKWLRAFLDDNPQIITRTTTGGGSTGIFFTKDNEGGYLFIRANHVGLPANDALTDSGNGQGIILTDPSDYGILLESHDGTIRLHASIGDVKIEADGEFDVTKANGDAQITVKDHTLALTGPTGSAAATRWVGATASGAPASGAYLKGDWVIAQNGHLFICTAAGTPGTWVDAGTGGGGGGGIDFAQANSGTYLDVESTGDDGTYGIFFLDTGGLGINLASAGSGVLVTPTTVQALIDAAGLFLVQGATVAPLQILGDGSAVSVVLAAGGNLTVYGPGNTPILRMTEGDPNLYIPTGGVVSATL